MSIEVVIFYVFGGMAVLGAFGVSVSRNPLTASMWLLLALFAVAGLFAWSGAHFLAAMQVLVYAGAVAVLFVFVIMLLNLNERELGQTDFRVSHWAGLAMVLTMLVALTAVAMSAPEAFPRAGRDPGRTQAMGDALMRGYVLPFEIISLLLLAAMAGAVMLTKRAQGEDALASINRIRATIDVRNARAFRPDAGLPGQFAAPARQQVSSDAPSMGFAKNANDPGDTL